MSSSQKATLALNLVVENCRAALIALSDKTRTDERYPSTDFATLRTDFISILSLLYSASTKVALSLKPGAPAHHGASLIPLKELSNYVAALLHSIRLMRQTQGLTLLVEYQNVAQNVISSVENFADGLSRSLSQSESGKDHFVAVGKIHELIDNAKKHGALSSDNRSAVRKKWAQDYDSLVDGAEEIEEMCNPAEVDGEDSVDDGWEELGLASKQTFSLIEKDRLKMVQALVKLSNLLHQRVAKDILSEDGHDLQNTILDRLSDHSSRLLAASDNLISAMYAPQQPSMISSYLDDYLDVLKDLQNTLLPQHEEELNYQMAALVISSQPVNKLKKWLTTCFEQIKRTGQKISEALGGSWSMISN